MIVVAENINVMSKSIGPAMRERDPEPIQKMAVACRENGADYLDINLGPARKGGPEMMQWVLKVAQEAGKLPCYLDTTNVDAIEAGLQAYDPQYGPAVINSISAIPDRMEKLMPLVTKYECEMVGLCYSSEGIPRDENERGILVSELMMAGEERSISLERMWIDPIVVPVCSQQNQVKACTLFMEMLPEIAPGAKSTCGLSNISNGSPEELRPILNQVYMSMLIRHQLYGAIVDGLDKDLIAIAKGQREDLIKLVTETMDNPDIDQSGRSKEEVDIIKTVRVLEDHALYSDSWLEL